MNHARNQRGSGGVGPIGAVLLTILILGIFRVAGFDLMGYFDAAVTWTADTLADLIDAIGDENRRQ